MKSFRLTVVESTPGELESTLILLFQMAQNASRLQERTSRLPQWNRECFAAPRARVDSKESKSRLLQWNRKQFRIRRARVDSQTAGVDSHRKIQRTVLKVPDGESTPELRESTPDLLKTPNG